MAMIYSRTKRDAPAQDRADSRGFTAVRARSDEQKQVDAEALAALRHASNPLNWTKYSKDANYSISGLGSMRRYKRYPGKQFPMAAAVWQESPAENERAARAATRAHQKSESGAQKSL